MTGRRSRPPVEYVVHFIFVYNNVTIRGSLINFNYSIGVKKRLHSHIVVDIQGIQVVQVVRVVEVIEGSASHHKKGNLELIEQTKNTNIS